MRQPPKNGMITLLLITLLNTSRELSKTLKDVLDIRKTEEYNIQNSLGGKAMLNRIDRFNNVVVMQSAVPAYFWQNNGLTLLYPFSSN